MNFYHSINAHRLIVAIDGKLENDFRFSDDIYNLLKNNKNLSELVLILRKLFFNNIDDLDFLLKEIKNLSEKNYEITIIECPKNVLDYLIKNHSKENIKTIRSFLVPYYCDYCNEEKNKLINTSCINLSFNAYKKPLCPTCKKHLSLDITEDEISKLSSLLPKLENINDKRDFARYEISSHNFYIELDDTKEKYKLINFSQEGICVSGQKPIQPGTTINFKFNHKKSKFTGSATVVWFSYDKISNYVLGLTLEDEKLYHMLIKI